MTKYLNLSGESLFLHLERFELTYSLNHIFSIGCIKIVPEEIFWNPEQNKIMFDITERVESCYSDEYYDYVNITIATLEYTDEDKFNLELNNKDIIITKL